MFDTSIAQTQHPCSTSRKELTTVSLVMLCLSHREVSLVMLCLSHRAMCTVLPSLKCNSEESPFHGDSSEGDCAFFVFPGLPCDNSCDYSKNSVHMLFNLFQFADPAQRFRHEFDAITTSAGTTFFWLFCRQASGCPQHQKRQWMESCMSCNLRQCFGHPGK
jgi:hypothetical protein